MDPQNPRPLFDFDLNELPPPDDGGTLDASPPSQDDGGKFDDASTTALERQPSPEDDVTADPSQADCLSPSQQMLDLDAPLSPMYDDEDEEDHVELQLPSPDPLYETDEAEVARSPEKMTSGGCGSPVIYHHAEVEAPAPLTARPYFHAGVDMATPARPSYRVDIHGSAAPFYFSPSRHGGRTSRPNSEAKPPPPPSAFPVRSSSETTSASRAHADAKGASDTSSPSSHRSRLKRRLSVPRDDSASDSKSILHLGNNYDDEDTTGSPRRRTRRSPRHGERSWRNSRGPPTRDQQAPRRNSSRYKPYDGRDQRGQGHRGHEKRQGYRADDHGPRGYAKPKFPVQQVCFDPYGSREDSYGGRRQVPAQEAPNGGYHQYREPPRGHFPASFNQRCHPYVSAEDGAFDGTKKKNPGNQRAMRDENHRPYFPASFNQRCHPYVSVDDAYDGTKKNPGNQRAVRDENRPDQHRRRRNRRQYYQDPYSQSPSGLS